MSSPWKQQPEVVVDKVLKRAEVSKIARKLQNRLALAQFKTKHGWEDLAFETIEPKVEEEMRRKRMCEGDVLSDSSSSASDLPYPSRALMSSPLKAPPFIKAHVTSHDEDDLPLHSFRAHDIHSSPPSTPPMRNRGLPGRSMRERGSPGPNGKNGQEGADLLLYLAASPSPAMPSTKTRMDPPSTPPSKFNRDMGLPSSHMTTPGGGNLFPSTPSQNFDFADFVNITPSPAQKHWKTPSALHMRNTEALRACVT
ncbi:hypothetical protein BN1708_000104 [Verticillium longisporum]|uniref:Cyclin-dependent kinase n=1 Tax=Verticillium longisporum TaxID=100787 RepID=A0A0G4KDG6_VERLO|nr:hypothetical protein BN1708_000104 [Verticillium longisporum]